VTLVVHGVRELVRDGEGLFFWAEGGEDGDRFADENAGRAAEIVGGDDPVPERSRYFIDVFVGCGGGSPSDLLRQQP